MIVTIVNNGNPGIVPPWLQEPGNDGLVPPWLRAQVWNPAEPITAPDPDMPRIMSVRTTEFVKA